MGRVIGIDLGTTNTAVAVLDAGRPRVIEDSRGYRVVPSCVSVRPNGRLVVGQAARDLVLTNPDRSVYAVKRLLGRRFDTSEAAETMSRVNYQVLPSEDGLCQVVLGDRVMRPVEVISIILGVAREMAETALGEAVDEAVVTVPAYFNHAQRAATLEAAHRAGLNCERLLNEPTAAALAYGYRRDLERQVLVYDLGGGTFDVSILHLSHGVYEVLATLGDTFLGGEDFDFRLVEYLAGRFETRTGVDLRTQATAMQRLKESAERAKCELSFSDGRTVFLPQITHNHNLEVAVSRRVLQELVEDLVLRTLDLCRQAVADAGLVIENVDAVLLVGGQTRMPRIREAITEMFGMAPSRSVHPEEVVALGAAIHAESLYRPDMASPLLIDVTPFDLGIESVGGLFSPLLNRNSKVPTSRTRTFTTVVDNQEEVRFVVRQGQSRRAVENEFLGEFILGSLAPAPRLKPKIDVTFRIDASGMLQVSATDKDTREATEITIRNYAQVALGGEGSRELPPEPRSANVLPPREDVPEPSGWKRWFFGRG